MTDEELADIRDSRDTLALHPTGRMLVARYLRHVTALLAEVERLRIAFDLADDGLTAEMMHNAGLGEENERLR